MKFLWDLRLYSLPYGNRGIGAYTTACARRLLESKGENEVFALGSMCDIPDKLLSHLDGVIPHQHESWKKDLLTIPGLIRKHHVDVMHYWVGAGPLHQTGIGAWHGCATIATLHDLGAQFWKGVPYLDHVRKTWYWRVQKFLLPRTNLLICNSNDTALDAAKLNRPLAKKTRVLYPPPGKFLRSERREEASFIALGGAPNKNLANTLTAFELVRKSYPKARMKVLGHVDADEETNGRLPEGVDRAAMGSYEEHLAKCSSLVACSTHEGLGLPPLEAMSRACPLVLSDIGPFRETCDGAACFVDPTRPESIARGMEEVCTNMNTWIERSSEGWKSYSRKSDSSFAELEYFTLFG